MSSWKGKVYHFIKTGIQKLKDSLSVFDFRDAAGYIFGVWQSNKK